MRKTIIAVTTLILAFGLPAYASDLTGGWSLPDSITISADAQAAFDNAELGGSDVDYEAVALLGTQVVAGTNYCFLCKEINTVSGEADGYCLIYVYEDLEGNSGLLGTEDFAMGLPPAEARNEDDTAPSVTNTSDPTIGEKNALSNALQYLNYTAFSHSGLVRQLEYEGYSHEEAVYGADNCGADWNEQAAKCAENYLNYTSFSRSGLIQQLEYEGFTAEQAEYGATAVGY